MKAVLSRRSLGTARKWARYFSSDAKDAAGGAGGVEAKGEGEKQPLNFHSAHLTQHKAQGAAQAMLYALGLTKEELDKPQVGIASVWYEGNPCNMHLLDLAAIVKKGVKNADMVGLRFNTIGVSDGMSMGTDGMSFSLPSRDIIADSIETVMRAQWYDANISLPGCDKNMPGTVMAMARINRPSLMIYGGSIQPGYHPETKAPLDIVSAFQSYGQYLSGEIDDGEREKIVRHACPGQGACGGMYTANTMASAIEAMGMSLPYSSSSPANSPEKIRECEVAGAVVMHMLKNNIKPKDIMTRKAFENAMVIIMALGGSTNAVLHLLAMAKSAGVSLTIDDFQTISDTVPFIADLKPSGKYVMADLHSIGGTPAVLKYLLSEGLIHGDCMTVTGLTLQENLERCPSLAYREGGVVGMGAGPGGQDLILPLSDPIKPSGHIQILKGNLAPQGSVAKITGKEGLEFTGIAKCFDSEEAMLRALEDGQFKKGEKVVAIIRYEGPKGGPGMPEMLTPTSAIMGAGLGDDVAMLTDGRFSGGSHGFIIGHITPEAQLGGPIAVVEDGDEISITMSNESGTGGEINVNLTHEQLSQRQTNWKAPPLKATQGVLRKYIKCVSNASHGCVTDDL